MTGEVVLLTIDTDLARIAARDLAGRFPDLVVIVEQRVGRLALLRSRMRRFGLAHLIGQMGFMLVYRVQRRMARRRIAEIAQQHRFDPRWPADRNPVRVASVNGADCIARLQQLKPRVVLVVGTRIISRKLLAAVDSPFINYHAGITPQYRGIHGGYWARAVGDDANFGVTVHLVDPGIDTGAVLYQARLAADARDNYSTYPYAQMAAALPLLQRAAGDALAGALVVQPTDAPSRLWSHPTLWDYVRTGLRRGVW